jgi:hypothetical protein
MTERSLLPLGRIMRVGILEPLSTAYPVLTLTNMSSRVIAMLLWPSRSPAIKSLKLHLDWVRKAHLIAR